MGSSTPSTTTAVTWGYGLTGPGTGASIPHAGRIGARAGARVRCRTEGRVTTSRTAAQGRFRTSATVQRATPVPNADGICAFLEYVTGSDPFHRSLHITDISGG